MLLALTRPTRSADLSQLSVSRWAYISPNHGKAIQTKFKICNLFLPINPTLCPVATLKAYEARTHTFHGDETRLLLAIIKPHHPVSSSNVACWHKSLLELSGIDTNIFNAHSVRGAWSSKAAYMGVTTNDILKAVNWSSESVFQRFYQKSSEDSAFGRAVLSSGSSYKHHWYVRLSPLKYNT